jgi:hypothetical protein
VEIIKLHKPRESDQFLRVEEILEGAHIQLKSPPTIHVREGLTKGRIVLPRICWMISIGVPGIDFDLA